MTRCKRCHEEHERCKGHNRAGRPCGLNPLEGQEVCHLHGGRSPQAQAAVRRREVEERARAVLRRRWEAGEEVALTDPLGELARLAGEVVAFKDYLRSEVDDLEQLTQEWSEKSASVQTPDGMREFAIIKEDMRAIVSAYERSLDRAEKVLVDMVKLDLAGRMLELRTAQADAIVEAVRYGLSRVDMATEVRRAAEHAIADALAGLSAPRDTPAIGA